ALVCDRQRPVQRIHAQVDLFLLDDQGWSDDDVADPGENRYPEFHHLRGDSIGDERLGFKSLRDTVQGLLGYPALDQINGPEQAESPHLADRRVRGSKCGQLLSQISSHLTGAFHQVQALHLADCSDGRCENQWVRLISVAVREKVIVEKL